MKEDREQACPREEINRNLLSRPAHSRRDTHCHITVNGGDSHHSMMATACTLTTGEHFAT